jgi:hypothetical protein
MINTATVIIPHAFMPAYQSKTQIKDFYQYSEKDLFVLADTLYAGRRNPPSVFSSWAASLHLVLCYAKSISTTGGIAYVAVIDTKLLEPEVLVWHVLHLLDYGNEEYLAFGIIRDEGYKAVQLQELEQHGLLSIFQELPRAVAFGDGLRHSMFQQLPAEIGGERNVIMALAPRFGNLALPVAIALMHIRPRPAMIPEEQIEAHEFVKSILKQLGISEIPPELHTEPWLAPGAVSTSGFLDVKKWIKTLLDLSKLDAFVRTTKEEEEKSSL